MSVDFFIKANYEISSVNEKREAFDSLEKRWANGHSRKRLL